MEAGHLPEALRLSDEALGLAERLGDEELIDQAFCNRCQFARALEQPEESFGRLREILMRNRSFSISFSAAYNLAYGFFKKKEFKKALFYAKIARDRALACQNDEFIAKGCNEIGNCLLAECYFEDAVAQYKQALKHLPSEMTLLHVSVYASLGYAEVMRGDFKAGFRLLFIALRWCRSHPAESGYESWIHISLAFAFLELRRWRYAWKHGVRGLELAESTGNQDGIKIALYLMGEIEKSAGDIEAAYRYFSRMQKEFFPETSNVPSLMMLFDTKKVVNLRA